MAIERQTGGEAEPLLRLRLDTSEAQGELSELQAQADTINGTIDATGSVGFASRRRRFDPARGRFVGGVLRTASAAAIQQTTLGPTTRALPPMAAAIMASGSHAPEAVSKQREMWRMQKSHRSLDIEERLRRAEGQARNSGFRSRALDKSQNRLGDILGKRRLPIGNRSLISSIGRGAFALRLSATAIASRAIPYAAVAFAAARGSTALVSGQVERDMARQRGASVARTVFGQLKDSVIDTGQRFGGTVAGLFTDVIAKPLENLGDFADEAFAISTPATRIAKRKRQFFEQPDVLKQLKDLKKQQDDSRADRVNHVVDLLTSAGRFETPNSTRQTAGLWVFEQDTKARDKAKTELWAQQIGKQGNARIGRFRRIVVLSGD